MATKLPNSLQSSAPISVKDFGAVADFTTNSDAAVSAAVTAAGANGVVSVDEGVKHDQTLIGVNTVTNKRQTQRLAPIAGSGSISKLYKAMFGYLESSPVALDIIGMGSSVGNGASLPDPSTQAPIAYFGQRLQQSVDPGTVYTWNVQNESVNGSTLSDAILTQWPSISATYDPKMVLMIYGMNDAQTAIFNAGQTYLGSYNLMRELCAKVISEGGTPIIVTSPHPHSGRVSWSMPGGVPQTYPTSIPADVPDESLVPPVSQSIINCDPLGYGRNIPVAHRFLRVNEQFRRVAAELGLPLIDAERYWFEALYTHDEDELYNVGETVHPNLLGHQLSYWRAIDDFINSVVAYGAQGTGSEAAGYTGFNVSTPSAAVHARPFLASKTALQVEAFNGDELVYADDAGNVRVAARSDKTVVVGPTQLIPYQYEVLGIGQAGTRKHLAIFNTGSPFAVTIPSGGGTMTVWAEQGGIGKAVRTFEYISDGTTTTLGSITPVIISGDPVTSVTTTGTTIVITPAAANTNIKVFFTAV